MPDGVTYRTSKLLACLAMAFGAVAVPAHAGNYSFSTLTVSGLPTGEYVSAASGLSNNGNTLLEVNPMGSTTIVGNYIYNLYTHSLASLPNNVPDSVVGTTVYYDVNNSGQAVGIYQPNTLGTYQSFLYSGGVFSNVSPPASRNLNFSEATGITNAGAITGVWEVASGHEQGYLFSGGTYTTIDVGTTPPNATFPFGINNLNQIVGSWGPIPGGTAPSEAFEYSGGVITTFSLGTVYTIPYAVNDLGVIVGDYTDDPTELTYQGFLDVGGVLSPFNVPFGMLTAPYGINDAGWIVGDYENVDGVSYAFLAKPVPEPPALVLLATGWLGLGLGRFRRRRQLL